MQYALPAIIAMTAASLYNMIDSIFIGQGVGPLAISGLAITFPLMNLSAAFGAAVGIGSSTCISVKLGQKDYRKAELIFGNSIVLNIIVGVAFGIISLMFLDPILYFFGASENTIPYAREYMLVVLAGNVFSQTFFGMNAILRAVGKPRHAMFATMSSVVLNTVLAPIFIWPLKMGIQRRTCHRDISDNGTCMAAMAVQQVERDSTLQERHIQAKEQHPEKHNRHRYVALRHERMRMHRGDIHQHQPV